MENIDDKNIVSTNPTKDFFISMLVKDITLKDAIGDLIDNSVDALKLMVDAGRLNYGDCKIEISLSENSFEIVDNGSGIDLAIAQSYAFRLGRPEGKKPMNNSIGRFGIGMKRAFFKLGNNIYVKSTSLKHEFEIEMDVNEWKNDEKNWNIKFKSIKELDNNDVKTGTLIRITSLTDDAKVQFKNTTFLTDLITEISCEQTLNLDKKINIVINNTVLKPQNYDLINSGEIVPIHWKASYKEGLSVSILAGVSTEEEDKGGWNIFCNDRLVVNRDTTELTGWTGTSGDGFAKYHQQFFRFRGYVFFNASDSSLLPWNTTKTGIDRDSWLFIAIRKKMIEFSKDILNFLNKIKREKEQNNPKTNQKLNNILNESQKNILDISKVVNNSESIKLQNRLDYPKLSIVLPKTNLETIKYVVEKARLNEIRQKYTSLAEYTPTQIGEYTFNYFFDNEIN